MRPILFIDFDKTLCFDKYWNSLDSENFAKLQAFLFGDDSALRDGWLLGKYDSEEINEIISEHLGLNYDSLWQRFVADCRRMKVLEGSFEKINLTRNNWRTILITDNMDAFDRFVAPALGLEKYFDLIVNSANYKQLKKDNDGELFRMCAEKFDDDLSSSVLIDNSGDNCEAFAGLGGTSIMVTEENDFFNAIGKLQ